MLGPSEERVIRTVKCLLDRGPDDRRWLSGEAMAWLDPDDASLVHTTVHARVEDWDVRVLSIGTAMAVWEGEGDAPGQAEWSELSGETRLLRLVLGESLPAELPLLVTLEMTEMGPEWDVCLALLNLGHLHLPYVPTPAMESL